MKILKKAGLGAAAGLAVSIPLTLLARRQQSSELLELAQRGGAVAASALGGTAGQVAYQAADYGFDKYVQYQGTGITGTGIVTGV